MSGFEPLATYSRSPVSSPSIPSYARLLESSILIGGAKVIGSLLGLLRVKIEAVLLGTSGVGAIANFTAIQALSCTISSFGLPGSAVREIARAQNQGDERALARILVTLRRTSWLTGLAGALGLLILVAPISQWIFAGEDRSRDIALLSGAVLLGNLTAGYLAQLQGLGRVGDIARVLVLGTVTGTPSAIGCYLLWGLQGIVPGLLALAGAQFLAAWFLARRVPAPSIQVSWGSTLTTATQLSQIGAAMVFSVLADQFVAVVTRTLITEHLGLSAAGIFSVAMILNGAVFNFIKSAMDSDYYPRLATAAADHEAFNHLANEQTEIGVLLAVPPLMVLLTLANLIVPLVFSDKFLPAVSLIPWVALGYLGQVIAHPLSFALLALRRGRLFVLTEALFYLLLLAMTLTGLYGFGLDGVGVALFAVFLPFTALEYAILRRLTGFRWSPGSRKLLSHLMPLVTLAFLSGHWLTPWPAAGIGLALAAGASVYCLRALVARVGAGHPLVRAITRVPGGLWICGLGTP